MNEQETKDLIIETIEDYNKSSSFTSRNLTDTPTDDLQIANKIYVDGRVITLTDAATISLDASSGSFFILTSSGNRTISAPSFAKPYRKKIIIIHKASASDRTLTLTTGAGGFRFGTDFTTLSATSATKTDYIGCIYNTVDGVWDVVAVTKGFS